MNSRQFVRLLVLLFCCAMMASFALGQVKIAQISDPHIGLERAPGGSQQLRQVVQMVNQDNPDIVVVTGDVGERESAWEEAREILKGLKAKVYYIPGNHDVHTSGTGKWRGVFGDDYYKIQVKNVTIYALDSQLLGNWDKFEKTMAPTPQNVQAEGDKMLDWLAGQGGGENRGHGKDHDKDRNDKKNGGGKEKDRGRGDDDHGGGEHGNVVLAMQHVPAYRDGDFPSDGKQYWTVPEPNSSREVQIFKKLGIRDVLVGHWHDGRVFKAQGITWHAAPSTSWSPFGSKLGYAVHMVSASGDVKTEFVPLK